MNIPSKPAIPLTSAGGIDWDSKPPVVETRGLQPVPPGTSAAPRVKTFAKLQQTAPELLMPEEVMYGKLGAATRTLSVPYGPGYCSLLTIFAGMFAMGVDLDESIRPTLYTVLLGPPHCGKSQAIDQALATLRPPMESYSTSVPGSDIGLLKIFGDDEQGSPTPPVTSAVLIQDELRSVMEKMGIQGSTLAPMVCTLWSKDEVGSASKRGHNQLRKRLSLLGGLAIANPGDFKKAFSRVTGDGLYDRCIFVPFPVGWKGDYSWRSTHMQTPDILTFTGGKSRTVTNAELFNRLGAWRDADPDTAADRGRLMEIGCRVALLSSMANGDSEVTEEAIVAAEKFVAWQARVRDYYAAGVAENTDAIVTDLILSAMAETRYVNPDGSSKRIRLNDLLRNRNYAKSYGGPLVSRVRKSLIDDEYIVQEMTAGSKEDRPRATGWYWLNPNRPELAE
jgi:hypothetical protein